MAELKKFKRSEIELRNSHKDAVFVIDNIVYDVTPFLDEHPGGHEVLVNVAGKDATEEFEDIGHSVDAKELMKKYVVGEVIQEDRIERQKKRMNWSVQQTESSSGWSWKTPVLVGIVLSLLYTFFF